MLLGLGSERVKYTVCIYSRVQFAQGTDTDAYFNVVSWAQVCIPVAGDHQCGCKLIYTCIPNDVSTGTQVDIASTHKRTGLITLEKKIIPITFLVCGSNFEFCG